MNAIATTLMTAEEFLRDYGDRDGFELDRGMLVEIDMQGARHGQICGLTYFLITEFVRSRNLGRTTTNDTFVRVRKEPDSYRGADVLYLSYQAHPKELPMPDGPLEIAPELVVEVRSPSDRLKKVIDKGQEYLDAGVKIVMIIDPETESVGIFKDDELPIRFHNGDIVTLPDLFPDFAVPVKAFFE